MPRLKLPDPLEQERTRPVKPAHLLLAAVLAFAAAAPSRAAEPPSYVQHQNLVYAEVHGVALVMDVFTPAGAQNGLGIVDVVSGAWHSDRGKLRDHDRAQVFSTLCGKGYTVFAIRPGSITKFTAPEMNDHLRRGIVWVKQRAEEYDIDPDRLGMMGASAGGHLACLRAVSEVRSPGNSAADDASVKAVAVFFPPTDLIDYGGRKIDVRTDEGLAPIVRRLTFSEDVAKLTDEQIAQRIASVSPARLACENCPPLLLIHGDADYLVPLQQSEALAAALKEKGNDVELIVKKGGGHPWPTIHEEVAVLADWFDRQLLTSATAAAGPIAIDGKFDDWAALPTYTDPAGDTHDTDHEQKDDTPDAVDHPDADLLEYKVAHDDENLYFYLRSRGQIGRTQVDKDGGEAGRYYVIVTIDVDDNDDTGYWIHEGGYYPTSRGYDVNAEIEYYNGELNTACYLNHGALDAAELAQAFLDQSQNKYKAGRDGPYPAGFMRLLPGTYKQYTQWVYHDDDTITFVRDKGPVVPGIATAAISADGHMIEAKFPLIGFLKDENGKPILAPGAKIDLSFSLEASGELAPGKRWASDTGEPVNGYVLTPGKPGK